MFPTRYFAPRYFAPRYWPPGAAVTGAGLLSPLAILGLSTNTGVAGAGLRSALAILGLSAEGGPVAGAGFRAALSILGLSATEPAPTPAPTGGGFFAQPDFGLEKKIRELRLEHELIKQQIVDRIRAHEHAKPEGQRARIEYSLEKARRLAQASDEARRLLRDLLEIQGKITLAEKALETMRDEDDLEVLLLL